MHKRDSHFNKMFHFKFLKCFGRCSITLGSSVYSLERWLMSLLKYIFKQFQLQKQIMKETVKEMKDFNRLLKSLVFQKLVSTTFQAQFCIVFFFFLPTFGIMDYFSIKNSPLLLISPYKFRIPMMLLTSKA